MKTVLSKSLHSLADLKMFAKEVKSLCPQGSTFLLSGDLAAGKTSFVSAFCELHNISEVSSPTYSIHNRYHAGEVAIDHFDLYRLESEEQLESSGFYDLCSEDVSYRFIEWPERASGVENAFSGPVYKLKLTKLNELDRKAELIQIN